MIKNLDVLVAFRFKTFRLCCYGCVSGSFPKLTFSEFENCGKNFKINIPELFQGKNLTSMPV